MKRRDFFASFLAGAAGALNSHALAAQGTTHRTVRRPPPVPPQFSRIGVSTWSFANYFQDARTAPTRGPAGRLALLDFPEMIADRYQIHNLEFATPHFPSFELTYLQELKSSLTRAHSKLINVPVDLREMEEAGGLSNPDVAVRNDALTTARSWIDIAKQLGAHSVRCGPGCTDSDDLTATIDSYQKLAAYGRAKGVEVLMENRSETGYVHPEAMVRILRAVASPFVGMLPDFSGFPDPVTRLRGLPVLFPYARTVCHVKGLQLDASGNETAFDFGRCMAISKQAGYKGVYSIEYEGSGDAYQGVQGVVSQLLRYL
jgi:sugar phosphate isomerase/epimerase